MKNLKLFVFSLCLMLVAVLSVNAVSSTTCDLPNQNRSLPACEASLNGEGYDDLSDAWTQFLAKGGDFVAYRTAYFNNETIKFSGSIEFADDYVMTIKANNTITVNKGVTLTVKNSKLTSAAGAAFTVNDGASLVLDNVEGTSVGYLVSNTGTTTITGGKYTSIVEGGSFIENAGTLNVTGTKVTAKQIQTTQALIKNAGTATLTKVDVDTTGNFVNVTGHGSTTTLAGESDVDARSIVVNSLSGAPASHGGVAAVVNVNGGTYKATSEAFNLDSGMKLNLTNGAVTAVYRGITMNGADVTISGGSITSKTSTVVTEANSTGSLTVTGGTLVSETAYPLYLMSNKVTYAVSNGTFESDVKDSPAIYIQNLATTDKDGKTVVDEAYAEILTGGKYLNNIIDGVVADGRGATVDLGNKLVAEGYEVKEVTEGKKTYKVIVKTGAAEGAEPEKQPEATKPGSTGSEELPPDTYDAGLTYMGLAVLAVGASVVSVRKLRNN